MSLHFHMSFNVMYWLIWRKKKKTTFKVREIDLGPLKGPFYACIFKAIHFF